MKYFPRLKMYKGSNCSFDPETLTALSYGWWPMLAVINGKLVRNGHNYSRSTREHQYKLRSLLQDLSIAPEVYLDVRADMRRGSDVAAELAHGWAKEEVRLKYARIKHANAWTRQIEAVRCLGPRYEVTQAMLQQALESAESNRRRRLDLAKAQRKQRPAPEPVVFATIPPLKLAVYPPLKLVK